MVPLSNGHRVEMITSDNVDSMLRPLVDWWMKNVGGGRLPKHVYYFRDGVSEGQYGPLLKNEVADMKRLFADLGQHHPDNNVLDPCPQIFGVISNVINRSR